MEDKKLRYGLVFTFLDTSKNCVQGAYKTFELAVMAALADEDLLFASKVEVVSGGKVVRVIKDVK